MTGALSQCVLLTTPRADVTSSHASRAASPAAFPKTPRSRGHKFVGMRRVEKPMPTGAASTAHIKLITYQAVNYAADQLTNRHCFGSVFPPSHARSYDR